MCYNCTCGKRALSIEETNEQAKKLEALIHEVSVFLHAPPIFEAIRRAGLIRRVLAENPE